MNEAAIRKILTRELSVEGIRAAQIIEELRLKNRVRFIDRDLHIKICRPDEDKFYNSLRNEIKVYENYKNSSILVPKLVYAFFEGVCIIATRKIDGRALGDGRNDFTLNFPIDGKKITDCIFDIKKFPVITDLNNNIDRRQKTGEYADILRDFIGEGLYSDISDVERSAQMYCFSHGDLLPSNIILDKKGDFWFIDWEWAANRTEFYDITFFTLFSDNPVDGIIKLSELAENEKMCEEMYCDGILIALHEIKNWLDTDHIKKEHYIGIWKRALTEALRRLKAFR
jgi:tRNA A-37 threonylcarbamoyl transferase component Bud32